MNFSKKNHELRKSNRINVSKTLKNITTVFIVLLTICVSAQNETDNKVIINHEEQYAIWPIKEESPYGWKDTGFHGNMDRCHQYIKEVWTDMRPLSVQKMNLPKMTEYFVVINHEEQYLVWPVEHKLPKNWKPLKTKGTLDICTAYIRKNWTDMRPLSIRKRTD